MGNWVNPIPYRDMGDSRFEPIQVKKETDPLFPVL